VQLTGITQDKVDDQPDITATLQVCLTLL